MTMTTYAILAVHLSRDGKRVEHVRWRQVDGASNRWSGELTEVDASDVADTLLRGDVVVTIFDHEGHRVRGANVCYAALADGHEGIATKDPENYPGRTLLDLPRF